MDIENNLYQNHTHLPESTTRLSPSAIKDFQLIYFKEFKKTISTNEAERLGMKLLRLFAVVYKPIRKDEYAK
ncbi:MAG: hypothetical protein WCW14_04935 [Candidatus Paceibacterota bacterium]|jgi:hypothetical protein